MLNQQNITYTVSYSVICVCVITGLICVPDLSENTGNQMGEKHISTVLAECYSKFFCSLKVI